jgi:hypothetical protein
LSVLSPGSQPTKQPVALTKFGSVEHMTAAPPEPPLPATLVLPALLAEVPPELVPVPAWAELLPPVAVPEPPVPTLLAPP